MFLLLLLGLIGLTSETVAMGFTIVALIAMLGCILVGQVWMAIAAGQRNVALGIVSFVIPLVGLVLAIKHRGSGMRGGVIYISSLLLAVMALVFVTEYKSRYTGQGKSMVRADRLQSTRDNLELMIRKSEQSVPIDAPVSTANFRFFEIGKTHCCRGRRDTSAFSELRRRVLSDRSRRAYCFVRLPRSLGVSRQVQTDDLQSYAGDADRKPPAALRTHARSGGSLAGSTPKGSTPLRKFHSQAPG